MQIVDDVCLYYEKINELEREYENKEEKEKENLQEEIKQIPLSSVPSRATLNDQKAQAPKIIKLENEIGELAGTVGWCFVCRASASLYCKDTKVPLCSVKCKSRHLDELCILFSLLELTFKTILQIWERILSKKKKLALKMLKESLCIFVKLQERILGSIISLLFTLITISQ